MTLVSVICPCEVYYLIERSFFEASKPVTAPIKLSWVLLNSAATISKTALNCQAELGQASMRLCFLFPEKTKVACSLTPEADFHSFVLSVSCIEA
jgi:hypothetical protein